MFIICSLSLLSLRGMLTMIVAVSRESIQIKVVLAVLEHLGMCLLLVVLLLHLLVVFLLETQEALV